MKNRKEKLVECWEIEKLSSGKFITHFCCSPNRTIHNSQRFRNSLGELARWRIEEFLLFRPLITRWELINPPQRGRSQRKFWVETGRVLCVGVDSWFLKNFFLCRLDMFQLRQSTIKCNYFSLVIANSRISPSLCRVNCTESSLIPSINFPLFNFIFASHSIMWSWLKRVWLILMSHNIFTSIYRLPNAIRFEFHSRVSGWMSRAKTSSCLSTIKQPNEHVRICFFFGPVRVWFTLLPFSESANRVPESILAVCEWIVCRFRSLAGFKCERQAMWDLLNTVDSSCNLISWFSQLQSDLVCIQIHFTIFFFMNEICNSATSSTRLVGRATSSDVRMRNLTLDQVEVWKLVCLLVLHTASAQFFVRWLEKWKCNFFNFAFNETWRL